MENLQKEYESIIEDDFFMKKQKLNELAKEILPEVNMDDPEELTNLLVQELVEGVSEEDSKDIGLEIDETIRETDKRKMVINMT